MFVVLHAKTNLVKKVKKKSFASFGPNFALELEEGCRIKIKPFEIKVFGRQKNDT
jgi:hypothetical protein